MAPTIRWGRRTPKYKARTRRGITWQPSWTATEGPALGAFWVHNYNQTEKQKFSRTKTLPGGSVNRQREGLPRTGGGPGSHPVHSFPQLSLPDPRSALENSPGLSGQQARPSSAPHRPPGGPAGLRASGGLAQPPPKSGSGSCSTGSPSWASAGPLGSRSGQGSPRLSDLRLDTTEHLLP